MEAVIRHTRIFVRAEVLEPLLTQERAEDFLRKAVATAGMNIIGGPWSAMGVVPGNEGVSATAILDLSSTSLHEWPEARPYPLIHFDLYTCGPVPDIDAFEALFHDLGIIGFAANVIDLDAFLSKHSDAILAESF